MWIDERETENIWRRRSYRINRATHCRKATMLVEVGGEDDERRGGAWAGGFREGNADAAARDTNDTRVSTTSNSTAGYSIDARARSSRYALWEGVGCR